MERKLTQKVKENIEMKQKKDEARNAKLKCAAESKENKLKQALKTLDHMHLLTLENLRKFSHKNCSTAVGCYEAELDASTSQSGDVNYIGAINIPGFETHNDNADAFVYTISEHCRR